MKIGVIGTGSWGTALVKVLTENGHFVKWYVHESHTIPLFLQNQSNPFHFPEIKLNFQLITLHENNQDIFVDTELILLACPSAYLNFNLKNIFAEHFKNHFVVSAIKGFIGEKALFVSEYLAENFEVAPQQFAVLSGPSHAEEVIQQMITFLQWGSVGNYFSIFEQPYLQIRSTKDYLGLQLAGILKNVYAIALGIVKGMDYGDNLQAALTTAASNETMQIFRSLNYSVDNFLQYGYLGDLLVTAYSPHSRNRRFGIGIGQGKEVNSIFKELKTIPEGYFTLQQLPKKLNINDFSILRFTLECIQKPQNAKEYLKKLLNRL